MITPLFRFLQLQTTSIWGKRAITAAILLCIAAALGSHSRGALLALAAMAMALWWYGGRQLGMFLGIVFVSALALMFLPEQWFSRMNTIGDYQSDASAMGRINAWWMAWNLASDRFFGGGFSIYDLNVFGRYAPDPTDVHAAHSIYFQVLGEHGFVGLFLFMTLWLLVWWNAGRLRKEARKEPADPMAVRPWRNVSGQSGWLCCWRRIFEPCLFRPTLQHSDHDCGWPALD